MLNHAVATVELAVSSKSSLKVVRSKTIMSESGRIPLWIVGLVAGLGVITVVGLFFYGAYAGLGSSI
jgi:photosystem II PsbJ protein